MFIDEPILQQQEAAKGQGITGTNLSKQAIASATPRAGAQNKDEALKSNRTIKKQ